jgi:hypothetical protein
VQKSVFSAKIGMQDKKLDIIYIKGQINIVFAFAHVNTWQGNSSFFQLELIITIKQLFIKYQVYRPFDTNTDHLQTQNFQNVCKYRPMSINTDLCL